MLLMVAGFVQCALAIALPALTVHRSVPAPRPRLLSVALSEAGDANRMIAALQSGLTEREMERLNLGLLPGELLPKEEMGLQAFGAAVGCCAALGSPPFTCLFYGYVVACLAVLAGRRSRVLRDLGWHYIRISEMLAARSWACVLRVRASPPALRLEYSARLVGRRARPHAAAVGRRVGALADRGRRAVVAGARRSRLDQLLTSAWRASPLPGWKAHIEWNWNSFLTQEYLSQELARAVDERRRRPRE